MIIKLAAVGLTAGIISETANQYTIAVIALSLPVSPFWIQEARGYFWSQALPRHRIQAN
ncbi:MAG: hypothetical protein PVJ15_07955 [Gammaproteobacteria bacterium]